MKQEEKDLLVKDLSSRLPYKTKVCVNSKEIKNAIGTLTIIDNIVDNRYVLAVKIKRIDGVIETFYNCLTDVKPYLRHLSSMTDEEKKELSDTTIKFELEHIADEEGFNVKAAKSPTFEVDFYNSHYLDYRGLIEKGLALEAPREIYNL